MEVQDLDSGEELKLSMIELSSCMMSETCFLLSACRIQGREYLLPVGIILKVIWHSLVLLDCLRETRMF